MIIEDGTGRGFIASVSTTNRLNASAKTNPRIFYASRDDGLGFAVSAQNVATVAAEYPLYLKNTSTTKNMFIKTIHLSNENICVWKIWVVTGTAAGGSVLTPSNLNLGSGLSAEATSRGNGSVTGLTAGNELKVLRSGASGHQHAFFEDALILTPGTAIAIEYDIGVTGGTELTIDLHYENLGAN